MDLKNCRNIVKKSLHHFEGTREGKDTMCTSRLVAIPSFGSTTIFKLTLT